MSLSLLWPDRATQYQQLESGQDLQIGRLAQALSVHRGHETFIKRVLSNLCTDPAVIRHRQDVLEDLLNHPRFTAELEPLLDVIDHMSGFASSPSSRDGDIFAVAARLGELDNFVTAVQALRDIFDQARGRWQSAGWRGVQRWVQQMLDDPVFQQMVEELPSLLEKVRGINSVTIGVNLSPDFRPAEATLLSINHERFTGPGFLGKLTSDQQGVGPLHRAKSFGLLNMGDLPVQTLFDDLAQLLKRLSQPIANALRQYMRVNSAPLRSLGPQIAFFLGAVRLIQRLAQMGLPMSRPEIASMADRAFAATELYNLHLALRQGEEIAIVRNDIRFDDEARILILTGPNRGGKTTFMEAVGVAHILAQAGLHVPASSATISPVDGLYLHFPAIEKPNLESGRLGEEAYRLRQIFTKATRHSLVLLNESLASTSADESSYLARDIVRSLRVLGARAIFVTHLHELAASSEAINEAVGGDSRVGSLVSMAVEDETGVQRTYKIVPAPPMGTSYAREIAVQYGISFEQLIQLLNQR